MMVLARVTMPPTEMSLLMSLGFRSRMTFVSIRLNIFTCFKVQDSKRQTQSVLFAKL